MSVLIKGMEMPTRCGRCDMCITEADGDIDSHKACCITGAIIENLGEKMEDCPLVSVPPHGRLIDADALYTRMEKAHTDWREHPERYNDVIPVNADEIFVLTEAVVIPAEEGE